MGPLHWARRPPLIEAITPPEREYWMEARPVQVPNVGAPRCPDCGEGEPLHIVYGYPSHDTFEASERGELALGGCVVEADSPAWRCHRCDHEWSG